MILPLPSTSVVWPLSPSIDVVPGLPGAVVKSFRFGVIEHDAPVSITIGNSCVVVKIYIVWACSGRSCL